MKKQSGIWLDYREALIINAKGSETKIIRVPSEVDTSHVKGGSRSKTPWGPMDKTSESKFLERRKHQETAYFSRVMETLREADEIYIFGPGEAKDGLVKAIRNNRRFTSYLRGVETADKMTIKQKVAWVKNFFAAKITP